MTKFMDDGWMRENGFQDRTWETQTVESLVLSLGGPSEIHSALSTETLADAVMKMKESGVNQLPVLDEERVIGIVTESDLLGRIVEGRATLSSSVAEVMFRNVVTIHKDRDAGELTKLLGKSYVGLVVNDDNHLKAVVTKMDLVDYLSKN
jgi:cystathionine beta-synthase